ncbi:dihydrolipoamide acetyltransferase family protein [soil metagenome]
MPNIEFFLPDLGEGLAEVELVRWLVAEDDEVVENQPVAEVESDKAIVSMPAPASGRVTRLCAAIGERVKVGSLLMVVDGDSTVQTSAGPATTAPSVPDSPAQEATASTAAVAAPAKPAVAASPSVRRRAAELGVELESVTGSGPRGRVTVDDVEQAAARGGSTPPQASRPVGQDPQPDAEEVPFRGVRRRIAEAMEHSVRTIPHVCGFHEFEADSLVRLQASLKPRAEALGVRLTYLPFIVKAVALTLKAHPFLNASLDDDAQVIRLKKVYNIGIATAAPEGLTVPVIRHADRLGLLQLAREADRLVKAARERTLAPGDLQDGTFTVTNVGASRGWLNTSIIRHPEVAILGAGRIEARAVVRGGQVVARAILPLALTFDHRVIDGAQGLDFMLALRALLEQPEGLLLGEAGW